MENFEFVSPTHFVFGRGAEEQVGEKLAAAGAKRVLVHFGGGSAVASGLIDRVGASLDAAGIEHLELGGVARTPEITLVREGVRLCKEANVDWVLAVGGGSVIDTTKGAAASISVGNRDIAELQGAEILQNDLDPLIAIPTTAGTGSEVTLVAVIADEEAHEKLSYTSYKLVPHVAFLDPLLTASLPPKLTATTGVDALTHAIEAYTSIQKNPVSDALARQAIALISEKSRALLRRAREP